MRILRAGARVARPWKNGGGTTTEVAAFPEASGLENFGWRVSIAEVAQSGAFSLFPGIDRHLVLLKGRVALTVAGMGTMELSPADSPVSFPGDTAADAHVIDGPATDLNVMTRRGAFAASLTRRKLGGAIETNASVTLAFPLSAATTVFQGTDGTVLAPTDAIFAEGGETFEIPSPAEFHWVEISPARLR